MTSPTLVWTDAPGAMYVRGPSRDPQVPLGGPLYGFAVALADRRWRVRSLLGARFDVTVPTKAEARLALTQIGGPA